MSSNKVDQRNLAAGGDIAGGDIHKVCIVESRPSRLEVLVDGLKERLEQDPEAREFVGDLQRWLSPKATEHTRGLQEKLRTCGKERLLKDAMTAKEAFTKQLARTKFQTALQDVYAHILGLIWGKFTHAIKPLIATDGHANTEKAIFALAEEIDQQLAQAPPELGLGIPEIMGMLYYLTGNCHLDWD